jgi:hypothetical protein
VLNQETASPRRQVIHNLASPASLAVWLGRE